MGKYYINTDQKNNIKIKYTYTKMVEKLENTEKKT